MVKCLPIEVKLMSSSKDDGTVGSEGGSSDVLEIDALFLGKPKYISRIKSWNSKVSFLMQSCRSGIFHNVQPNQRYPM